MTLLVAIIFLFDSSPSVDVEFYFCALQERHRVEVVCPAGLEPPCYGTSSPEPVPCDVFYDARASRPSEWFAEAEVPMEHQALVGCVMAVDLSGNQSECIGGAP